MPPAPPPIKSERTRARLIDAAIEVIEGKGLAQLSVHEVARTAGLSSGAVQHHFASKALLMVEVLSTMIARLEAATTFWPHAHWPLERRANHFVQQAWVHLYGHPRFAVAWSAYLAARSDDTIRHQVLAQRAAVGQRLEARFRECFPEIDRLRDAPQRIQFILSALRGMGLLAPFSTNEAMAPQLQMLSAYIQSINPKDNQ